ncbi:MAG: hypothetical protein ACP5KN_11655 [Armatimonadota bacterium]
MRGLRLIAYSITDCLPVLHNGGGEYAFADGHAKRLKPGNVHRDLMYVPGDRQGHALIETAP